LTEISKRDPAVVIIGSGAAGGTVAHELVTRGIKVVLLEAGREIGPAEFIQDDMAAFGQLTWMDKRRATGNWLAATSSPAMPLWTVKAVGGSTLHWNGLAYRMQAHEFEPRTRYGQVAGTSLADWPITLEDLLPFYERAEDKLGVTGTHGIPRHPANNNYRVLWNAAKRAGYGSISNGNLAINSEPRDGRAGCIQMGFCNQGCKIGAKWSTQASEIPKAIATGRLDLRTGCMAVRIEHDASGRASAVVYRDGNGVLQSQVARVVCVAGNAVETARVLLLSDSGKFPSGLGNGWGHVGRHYTHHVGGGTFGVMPKPVNMHRGISVPGSLFDEARHDETRGFVGGYLIQAMSVAPSFLASLLDAEDWGERNADFMEKYDHLAGLLICGEDMPRADNRVTLDREELDALGLRIPCIHVDVHENDRRMEAHGRLTTQVLMDAVGAVDVRQVRTALATHNMGTARMSRRPEDGVVDSFGRVHEMPNLFVSDGSVFPSSSAENPTLTIVALALRQADSIAERLGRGDL
jgi:choline dehydrogenase-like flavoprotein